MRSLITACRYLWPCLATAAGVVELDNVMDVAPYLWAILVPAVLCGGVVTYDQLRRRITRDPWQS